MAKKRTTQQEVSFTGFFMEAQWGNGTSTGRREFVTNGVRVAQVLKDGKWVTVEPAAPPPQRSKVVTSKVVETKALPAPASDRGKVRRARRAPPRPPAP